VSADSADIDVQGDVQVPAPFLASRSSSDRALERLGHVQAADIHDAARDPQ